MITKEYDGISWLEFELLSNFPVTNACFKRHGGYSSGHLKGLNFGSSVGDSQENIEKNTRKALDALNIPQFIKPGLCHGSQIISTSTLKDSTRPICDGLTTHRLNLGLLITQADCQAAIFYDPVHHVLANVHCGWRGSVQNIYDATIKHLQEFYHSNPKDLIVCIAPSLGPDHSEFINYKSELPESFWDFQIKPNYFDFWSISEWQLQQAGILPNHIQIARIDTFDCEDDYYSHRRSKATGRQATICSLKERSTNR